MIPLEHIHKEDSLFISIEEFSHKRVAYAVTYIEPIGSHDRIFDIFDCEPEQSLLLLKQMHYTAEDESVLYSANYFLSDMFRFYVLGKRLQRMLRSSMRR